MTARRLRTDPVHAATLALLACCTPAQAKSPALDRASLWLGGYFASPTVDVRAQSTLGNGDVEFAGEHETLGRARLDVLVGRRHGFTFDHYTFGHAAAQSLDRTYTFDDVVFDVSGELHSRVDFHAGSAAWHWWFGEDDNLLGVGLGAAWYRIELALSGVALVNEEPVAARAGMDESAIAPLVNVGYRHAFSADLRLYANASGVARNGGSVSGNVFDARIGMEWFPWRHVGFSGEYVMTRIRIEKEHDVFHADFDLDLHGPALYLRARF